jgi:hypothetical protein
MLLRREVEGARAAPAVNLDVVVLVRAVGHVVVGQVRDAGEQVAERRVLFLGLVLQPAISSFFSATSARRRSNSASSPWPLPADLLRGRVAFGQRGLGGLNAGAARLVEGEDLGRHGREAPAGEGGVEGLRGLADGADVVHGGSSAGRLRGAYGEVCGAAEGGASSA